MHFILFIILSFSIQDIPAPQELAETFEALEVKSEKLHVLKSLTEILPEEYACCYRIGSYTLHKVENSSGSSEYDLENKGNSFTSDEIKLLIHSLNEGDILYIRDVKLIYAGKEALNLTKHFQITVIANN